MGITGEKSPRAPDVNHPEHPMSTGRTQPHCKLYTHLGIREFPSVIWNTLSTPAPSEFASDTPRTAMLRRGRHEKKRKKPQCVTDQPVRVKTEIIQSVGFGITQRGRADRESSETCKEVPGAFFEARNKSSG